MKKRAIGLLEMTVMLLVFALAAALCLRLFAWADSTTRESIRRDAAFTDLQSAAEVLRHTGGDYEEAVQLYGGSWDGNRWVIVCDGYRIAVTAESTGISGLGGAYLEAVGENQILASLTVRWQEVSYGQ